MAMKFCDGFSIYGVTADVGRRWTAVGSAAYSTTGGRNSGGKVRVPGSASALIQHLPSQATWIIGFAANFVSGSVTTAGSRWTLLRLKDTVSAVTGTQITLCFNPNGGTLTTGAIEVWLGDQGSGTLLETANLSTASVVNSWHFYELKILIAAAGAGSVAMQLDGNSFIAATAHTTKFTSGAGSAALANSIEFGGTNLAYNFDLCDVFMCDGTGGVNNDFLGDMTITTLFPDGNVTVAWIPTPGASPNYACVNEHQMDVTTYVATATPTAKDEYTYQDVINTPTIKAVQLTTTHIKENAGDPRTFHQFLKSGATTSADATVGSSSAGLVCQVKPFDQDPNGPAAWTYTAVNALTAGVVLDA